MGNENNVDFSREELKRYSRHFTIPEFGREGQEKLKEASVLVVGAGGLGAPVLQYLAAAGVGTIGIVDFDRVEASNLHRQVLFGVSDVDRLKVKAARERLQQINPHIDINTYNQRLNSDNALQILENYDVAADGTDNFATRYLVNDACVFLGIPDVQGTIFQFEGQLSVFNGEDKEGNKGPNYRDLFPEPPPPNTVPTCAEAGVLGVLPGIIGSLQANEVIKIITGIGQPLIGEFLRFDAKSLTTRKMQISKSEENPLTGKDPSITKLIDYELFCGTSGNGKDEEKNAQVKEVSVQEYQSWIESGEDVQLVDVRKPYELDIAEIGGDHIPMDQIVDDHQKISRDKKVVIHCRSGKRSARAVKQLQEKYQLENLYSLKGGILAWSKELDDTVPEY